MSFELQETTIHGHRVAYRLAGSGPPLVLIHGITASSAVWDWSDRGSRVTTRCSRRTCSDTDKAPSPGATTRWVRSRRGFAT